MPEPRKAPFRVVDLDEDYQGPEPSKSLLANAVKEGRRRATAELAPKLRQADMVAALQEAHHNELRRIELQNAREEAKHVRGALGWGALWGALAGILVGAAIPLVVVMIYGDAVFTNAGRITQQGVLVGAAAANQDPANRGRDVPHIGAPTP